MVSAKQIKQFQDFNDMAKGKITKYSQPTSGKVGQDATQREYNSKIFNHIMRNITRDAQYSDSCVTYIDIPYNAIPTFLSHGFKVEKEPDDECGWYYVITWPQPKIKNKSFIW